MYTCDSILKNIYHIPYIPILYTNNLIKACFSNKKYPVTNKTCATQILNNIFLIEQPV